MVNVLFINCKKDQEKEENEKEEMAYKTADSISDEISTDSIAKSDITEWQNYKNEANKAIAENDTKILELRMGLKKTGKQLDKAYEKSVNELEEKNAALKRKIKDYKINDSNWDSFKREFESDMEGIGKAFKDLTINNKK